MLPSYVETILITLFGIMGDQWAKHHTLRGYWSKKSVAGILWVV